MNERTPEALVSAEQTQKPPAELPDPAAIENSQPRETPESASTSGTDDTASELPDPALIDNDPSSPPPAEASMENDQGTEQSSDDTAGELADPATITNAEAHEPTSAETSSEAEAAAVDDLDNEDDLPDPSTITSTSDSPPPQERENIEPDGLDGADDELDLPDPNTIEDSTATDSGAPEYLENHELESDTSEEIGGSEDLADPTTIDDASISDQQPDDPENDTGSDQVETAAEAGAEAGEPPFEPVTSARQDDTLSPTESDDRSNLARQAAADSGLPDQTDNPDVDLNRSDAQTIYRGDPVDVATGEFVLMETDISLPGVLTLALTRRHRSNYRFGRWFGPSWAATLDSRVVVEDIGVKFVGPDGEVWQFPHAITDFPVTPVHTGTRATLSRTDSGGYLVHDLDREITFAFHPNPNAAGADVALGNLAITAIADVHGNRVTFHYNVVGQPVEVVHSGGYRVRVETTGDRVTGLTVLGTAPTGESIETVVREFGYNAGNLTTVTNGVGASTTYRYDDEHRMVSWRDSRGTEMHNIYDRSGRVVKQVGTDGIMSATFAYEDLPEFRRTRTLHTNSLGHTTIYEFDEDLCLRNMIDPRGATSITDFNEFRQPVRHVDPYANITTYVYNPDGDLILLRRPDQRAITIDYAAPRRPATITDVDGTTLTRTYDAHGNPATVTDADGVTTIYTHHPCGAPASITLSTGATTRIDVDPFGLPIRVTEPGNVVTSVERDTFGRPVVVTDPLSNSSTYTYSAEGKTLSHTDPEGATQSWTYDGEGNLLTHTNEIGAVTRYTYGTFDVVRTRESPDGSVTSYTHDTERRLTSVTNPLGDTWTYEYDASGNVCTETDYNGSVTTTEYDLLNRATIVTTPTGVQQRHSYDILGRFTGVSTDTGEWISRTYTPTGQLSSARNGLHGKVIHSITFEHTPAGRLLTQRVDDHASTYAYDSHGFRIGYRTPSGASVDYERTPTGRVAALTTRGHRFTFTHDAVGRQNSWHSAGIGQHNAYSPTGYTLSRELVQLDPRTSTPAQLLERDEYAWRADGYITSHTTRTATGNHRRDYTLDVLGRITHITTPVAGVTEHYAYDALSNLTTVDLPTAPELGPTTARPTPSPVPRESAPDPRFEYRNNLLIRASRTRYHYDAAGRLIRKEKSRLSRKPSIWHYRYNAFDQLVEVTTPDATTWTYTYDPFGRRTTKHHQATNTHTAFTWDGPHLTEQTTTTPANTRTHTWTNHPTTHVPLTQTVDDQFWAIVTNLQGQPTHLADPTTGEITSTATTTLWGRTTWTGPDTPHRFQGQQHDPETGLHYNFHRYYDPETARYLTQDPLGLAPAPNPGTFPRNPLRWSDPLGLAPDCGGIALGFSELDGDPMALLDFASSVGAHSYHDWPSQGDDWVNEFQNYVRDGETSIHFNLDGLDDQEWLTSAANARGNDPRFDGHATPWELSYIMENRTSMNNVFFYRNGARYDNPFT
ncbi:DUF6531 domain-containing protein [Nocardia sp. JW2]|uniref:DUF6531 domain-containing protein n=1 Tax=Nocardia sp. JW2 TaxID=3450738 RepID=UPI003F435BF8